MASQTQMVIRVGVPDEEPAVDEPFFVKYADLGSNVFDERTIGSSLRSVQLHVKPWTSWDEPPLLFAHGGLGPARRNRRGWATISDSESIAAHEKSRRLTPPLASTSTWRGSTCLWSTPTAWRSAHARAIRVHTLGTLRLEAKRAAPTRPSALGSQVIAQSRSIPIAPELRTRGSRRRFVHKTCLPERALKRSLL